MTSVNSDTASGYLHESDCRLEDFIAIVETQQSSIAFPSRTIYHVTQEGEPAPAVPVAE